MLTGIEWIVVIAAVFGIIKLLMISFNKKGWMPVVNEVYDHQHLFSWIFTILAIIVFWVLIKSMSIVQIFAVMAFYSLMLALAFMHYGQDVKKLAKKMVSSKITGWLWFYVLIWLIIMVWALWSVFA